MRVTITPIMLWSEICFSFSSTVNKHKPWIETSYHGVITENMDTVLLDPPLVALDKDAPVPYAGRKTNIHKETSDALSPPTFRKYNTHTTLNICTLSYKHSGAKTRMLLQSCVQETVTASQHTTQTRWSDSSLYSWRLNSIYHPSQCKTNGFQSYFKSASLYIIA